MVRLLGEFMLVRSRLFVCMVLSVLLAACGSSSSGTGGGGGSAGGVGGGAAGGTGGGTAGGSGGGASGGGAGGGAGGGTGGGAGGGSAGGSGGGSGGGVGGGTGGGFPDGGATGNTPFIDPDGGTYKGFPIGLYTNGNQVPAGHRAAGLVRANQIVPLDTSGNPNANGKYILLSIGYSNATQEFCNTNGSPTQCATWTFMGQVAVDPQVKTQGLVVFNGAFSAQTNLSWDQPSDSNYTRVAANLSDAGYSENQVQAVWLKIANPNPTVALPAVGADAYQLTTSTGDIARTLKVRYPNLKLVFVSSRTYAGWASTTLNPEPYAYEGAFAIRWVIEAQVNQMNGDGGIDARAGNLNYGTVAPWIGWGPYLWTDGLRGRSDGLVWTQADVEADGTHPSQSGETKVGGLLKQFFKTSPVARCWFITDAGCP